MSWSPDLFIGELRPWPDSVHVVRGKTDEARRYTPERKDGQEVLERRIDELCAEVERGKAEFKKMDVWHSQELKAALDENAKLRELCADIYKRFHGVVFECWAYSSEDFRMYEQRMRELGIEVDG